MPDLEADRGRLRRALTNVLGRGAGDAAVRVLAGGLSNSSYAVTHGGRRYVVRLARPTAGSTLTLDDELALLHAVAAAGLTPEPIGVDAATGALVTRYLPGGKPWSADDARDLANIERIAVFLRRLHRVPAQIREFVPTQYAQAYIEQAGALDARAQAAAAELRELAADYRTGHAATCVCHNDLVAANVLDDGQLWLVDFEYAASSSPILDLASLAVMNAFGPEHVAALLRAYCAPLLTPFPPAEFAKVARLVELTAYFWELASAK